MMLRALQFALVSAAVYFVFPLAFEWDVDPIQAVSITLLTYLFGLIIANPQEINVAVMKAEDFQTTKEDE